MNVDMSRRKYYTFCETLESNLYKYAHTVSAATIA